MEKWGRRDGEGDGGRKGGREGGREGGKVRRPRNIFTSHLLATPG